MQKNMFLKKQDPKNKDTFLPKTAFDWMYVAK